MDNKTYLCYVPKKHITEALLDQIEWLIDKGYEYNECIIIDNISKGYRIYPQNLKNMMCRCNTLDIIDTIYDNINNKKTAIILNDFDIDIDDIKDIYSEITTDNNVMFIIFNSIKTESEEKLMIKIKNPLYELNEKEWIELKEDILKHIDNYMEDNKIINTKGNKIINNIKKEDKDLKELLNIFKEIEPYENEEDYYKEHEEEDYNKFALRTIKEKFMYQKKNDTLIVSLVSGNDLIISDGDEQVIIKRSMINYLIETIEHIKGEK